MVDPRSAMVMACMLLAGCTPANLSHKATAKQKEQAYIETSAGYVTNGKPVKIDLESIDGQQVRGPFTWATPGLHKAIVKVEWSNGYVEKVSFTFTSRPGRKYRFSAFELKPGQDAASAVLKRKTFSKEMIEAGEEGILAGLFVAGGWVIAIPVALFYKTGHSSKRPFENCCFIWLEDVADHRMIAGRRPSGLDP